MTCVRNFTTRCPTWQIAPITQLLARAANMTGRVRTQPDVTVFTLVSQGPFTVFPGQPSGQSFISDPFVRQATRIGRCGWAATAPGTTASATDTARPTGPARATIARAAAFEGAVELLIFRIFLLWLGNGMLRLRRGFGIGRREWTFGRRRIAL